MSFIRLVRSYSSVVTKRPALQEILPSKRSLQKLLFDYDSRLNYNKYIPTITKIYDHLDTQDIVQLPKNVTGKDLMLFRSVLKEIRQRTRTINRNLLQLENELIEYSAELGDNNAVAILLFECIKNPDINTEEDLSHLKHLVKELVTMKHPLLLKLSGDLAYQAQNFDKCEKFYQDFLKVEDETMLSAEVYQNLGVLYFQKLKDLNKLEKMFQRAIKLTTLDKLSHSYFHLGLLYEDDPKLSRYYFEMAASQGLLESFANLGFLELNVFQNTRKLIEWFKLGVELGDFNSLIGLFDCFIKSENYKDATKTYDNIKLMISKNEKLMTLDKFHDIRLSSMEKLSNYRERINDITASTSKWEL